MQNWEVEQCRIGSTTVQIRPGYWEANMQNGEANWEAQRCRIGTMQNQEGQLCHIGRRIARFNHAEFASATGQNWGVQRCNIETVAAQICQA
jgi:hypothetical protein